VIVLVLLLVVWLAVLVPQAVKGHLERRRELVDHFSRQLGALEAASPAVPEPVAHSEETGLPPPPRRRMSAARRRRRVVAGLLVSVAFSGLAAVAAPAKSTLAVNLLAADCLIAYVSLLVRRRDLLAARTGRRPPVVAPLRPALALGYEVARDGRVTIAPSAG